MLYPDKNCLAKFYHDKPYGSKQILLHTHTHTKYHYWSQLTYRWKSHVFIIQYYSDCLSFRTL